MWYVRLVRLLYVLLLWLEVGALWARPIGAAFGAGVGIGAALASLFWFSSNLLQITGLFVFVPVFVLCICLSLVLGGLFGFIIGGYTSWGISRLMRLMELLKKKPEIRVHRVK